MMIDRLLADIVGPYCDLDLILTHIIFAACQHTAGVVVYNSSSSSSNNNNVNLFVTKSVNVM